MKELFDLNRGLFIANAGNELYPNPVSGSIVGGANVGTPGWAYASHRPPFRVLCLCGQNGGKTALRKPTAGLPFRSFLSQQMAGENGLSYGTLLFLPSYLRRVVDDLPALDAELYRNLIFLRNYKGDFDSLALDFTVTDMSE